MRLKRAVGRRTEPIVGSIATWMLRSIRHLDPDRISDLAGGFMRAVGPLLPEHRIARANLAAAYPEKSAAQIGTILGGAWENLGRLAAEFPHLDRLWDFQPDSSVARRIEFVPGSIERLLQLRDDGKPALLFSAHLANWELLARVSELCAFESMILYRRARMAKLDSAIREMRSLKVARLIPAAVHAPLKIAHALKHGVHVSMLVDQYDTHGVDVTFFGRPTKASPLIARLARLVDCPIHGIRIIRLPGHRFQVELTDAVAPIRQVDGKIDVAGTMQAITSVIESWVRDHPEQWLWQHRRWR
jgi:KDO2-lipid IV(A) lauroyltransferase